MQVEQHEADAFGVATQDAQRFRCTRRDEDFVPFAAESVLDERQDAGFVVDGQHADVRAFSAGGGGLRSRDPLARGRGRGLGDRQEEREGRTVACATRDEERSLVRLDDSVGGRESEAASFELGREERVEHAAQVIFLEADAVVADFEHGVPARRIELSEPDAVVGSFDGFARAQPQCHGRGFDTRVLGVRHQVDEHLLDRRSIDRSVHRLFGELDHQASAAAIGSLAERAHARDDVAQVHDFAVRGGRARVVQQARAEVRGTAGRVRDVVGHLAVLRVGRVGEQFRVAANAAQDVVEVVREAGRQQSEAVESLEVEELALESLAVFFHALGALGLLDQLLVDALGASLAAVE